MVLQFDPERVWHNARQASTEDLLDRVTVYRAGMEPEALAIIEEELRQRGVSRREIEEHERRTQDVLYHPDGSAVSCSFCSKPAVTMAWAWHRLWKVLPVFPRRSYYCADHM